jgi:hypothetical protein
MLFEDLSFNLLEGALIGKFFETFQAVEFPVWFESQNVLNSGRALSSTGAVQPRRRQL